MTETGKVQEIKGNLVVITVDKTEKTDINDACFGCMNMECKVGGCSITAENTRALRIEIGQMVEVQAKGVSLLGQALTAFLPPILGFITGYAILRLLFPEAGEGAFAGMGVVFLFAAAFIVYKARKKRPPEEIYSVTRIIG